MNMKPSEIRGIAMGPEEYGYADVVEGVKEDLRIIKWLGFNCVKLWNVESMLLRGHLEQVLEVFDEEKMPFYTPIMIANTEGKTVWPEGDWPLGSEYKFREVARKTVKTCAEHSTCIFHALWIPWGGQRALDDVYFNTVKRILPDFREADPTRRLAVWGGAVPPAPYDWSDVSYYGLQPYSLKKNEIDEERIDEAVGACKGTKYYPPWLDEYGFRTFSTFRHGIHGLCDNEIKKAEAIEKFVEYMNTKHPDVGWVYFMWKDRYPLYAEGDWGLIEWNGILRESGRAFKRALRNFVD